MKKVPEKALFCNLFDLPCAMNECLSIFKSILEDDLFILEEEFASIEGIASLLKEEVPRNVLMPSIRNILPSNTPEMEPEELVNSPLFPVMILLAAKLDALEKR